MSTSQQKTGDIGENLAEQYLITHNFQILERNWHCNFGEIDIIAKDQTHLVFIEVRTRHSKTTESAFASITESKKQKLIRSAYTYIHQKNYPDDTLWRIDMIAIALPKNQKPIIEHSEDIFGW